MSPNPAVDQAEICRALNLFCTGITEIRLLKCESRYGKPFTIAGYFDHAHFKAAAEEVARLDRECAPRGCYFVFNEVHPACHARAFNRFQKYPEHTTGDKEIVRRRWLYVDVDPKRPAGVSSSDQEKESAVEARELVVAKLTEFADPIVADSGNGWHLYIPLDAENTEEQTQQIKNILTGLKSISDLVDTTASNAARLTKLYGTTARKGDPTPERPHRIARIIHIPDYLHRRKYDG